MSDKFSRKQFLANVENFLEAKRAAWVKNIVGTPLEKAALAYAKREFILPTEDLNCVTSLDLFPNVDLGEWAMKCERGMASREEASKAIRAAVIDGLREANAGMERIRYGVAEPLVLTPVTGARLSWDAMNEPPAPIPATLPSEKPPEQAPPPPAIKSTASGIPSSVASTPITVHYITIGGMELHSLDRAVMELAQQAQIQKRPVRVEYVDSPLGKVIIKAHL